MNCLNQKKKVAEYILANAKEVMHMSIHELAAEADASSAAVVRFCRSIGIDGFPALKIRLSAEVENTPHVGYFDVESNESVHSIIEKMLSNTILTFQNTASQLDAQSIEQAVNTLQQAEVIYVYGIGASFIIAEDAAQKWLRLAKMYMRFQIVIYWRQPWQRNQKTPSSGEFRIAEKRERLFN